MIKNVVFDLGGVLIHANASSYLNKLGCTPVEANHIESLIFPSKVWNTYDRGDVSTNKEILDRMVAAYPTEEKGIRLFLENNWMEEILYSLDMGVSLLKKLKQMGLKLYVLSNFPVEPIEYVMKRNDFFELFDGLIISSYVHMVKPNDDIYQCLLSTYNLDASETLFLDDRKDNIDSAIRNNINGIVYKEDKTYLINEFKKLGLEINF